MFVLAASLETYASALQSQSEWVGGSRESCLGILFWFSLMVDHVCSQALPESFPWPRPSGSLLNPCNVSSPRAHHTYTRVSDWLVSFLSLDAGVLSWKLSVAWCGASAWCRAQVAVDRTCPYNLRVEALTPTVTGLGDGDVRGLFRITEVGRRGPSPVGLAALWEKREGDLTGSRWLPTSQEESPHQKPNQLEPWSWTYQSPELWENEFLSVKPLSMWYSVIAARSD